MIVNRSSSKLSLALGALLLVLSSALASPAYGWWNEDWQFRKRIDLAPQADGYTRVGLSDTTVLVRLHTGNFPYFLDASPDGSDIRFVATDDITPLNFEIERFDGIAGIAALWVKLPRIDPNQEDPHFWMYYGNEDVAPASDGAASFDTSQTAVYHFNEGSGLPADATAFGHTVTRSSAEPGSSGLVDAALKFDNAQSLEIEATPALTIDAERGTTISFWLRPEGRGEALAQIFTQDDRGRRISLLLDDLTPVLLFEEMGADGNAVQMREPSATELQLNAWHHVAMTIGSRVRLWVDGVVVTELDDQLPNIGGTIIVGATNGSNGVRASIDELRLAGAVRPDAWIQFQRFAQHPDSLIVAPGADETRDSTDGIGQYFELLWGLLGAVRVEGWIILVSILVMGILSADVVINKYSILGKVERADREFLATYEQMASEQGPGTAQLPNVPEHSCLGRLFQVGTAEWEQLRRASGGVSSAEALDVVRSALDAETVEQLDRLSSRLVLMTIAVSGGPFLGLLGTVVGVMITFATIAAVGDVNVNTIAPGVSAALTTTVMGLLLAIPSLFAYNHLTTRISRRTTAMEVFADRLVARFAMAALPKKAREEGIDHAA